MKTGFFLFVVCLLPAAGQAADPLDWAALKKMSSIENELKSVLREDLSALTSFRVEKLIKELESVRGEIPDADFEKLVKRLNATKAQVAEWKGLEAEQAAALAKIAIRKREVETQFKKEQVPSGSINLFPKAKEHQGALDCGVFGAATKPIKELFENSGYTDAEIRSFEAAATKFGTRLPGLDCPAGVSKSITVDARTALNAVITEVEKQVGSDREKKELLEALNSFRKSFQRREDRQRASLKQLRDEVQVLGLLGVFGGEFGGEGYRVTPEEAGELSQVLDTRAEQLRKEPSTACIPCEERHRNDFLLFLASKRHYAQHMQDLTMLRGQLKAQKDAAEAAAKPRGLPPPPARHSLKPSGL